MKLLQPWRRQSTNERKQRWTPFAETSARRRSFGFVLVVYSIDRFHWVVTFILGSQMPQLLRVLSYNPHTQRPLRVTKALGKVMRRPQVSINLDPWRDLEVQVHCPESGPCEVTASLQYWAASHCIDPSMTTRVAPAGLHQ
jgi:hypothetical protein